MFGILRQVLKWAGAIYDRYTIPNQEKSGGAYGRSTPEGARVVPFQETGGRKWPSLTPNDGRPTVVCHPPANSALNVPSGAFSNVPSVTDSNVPLQMWLL